MISSVGPFFQGLTHHHEQPKFVRSVLSSPTAAPTTARPSPVADPSTAEPTEATEAPLPQWWLVESEDFENGQWGNWNGGAEAEVANNAFYRCTEFGGTRCALLRDNSDSSYLSLSNVNVEGFELARLEFEHFYRYLDTGQDYLEVSARFDDESSYGQIATITSFEQGQVCADPPFNNTFSVDGKARMDLRIQLWATFNWRNRTRRGNFQERLCIHNVRLFLFTDGPVPESVLGDPLSTVPTPAPTALSTEQSSQSMVDAFLGFLAFLIISLLMLFAIVCVVRVSLSCYRRCCLRNAGGEGNNNNSTNHGGLEYDQGTLCQSAGLSPFLLLSERVQILEAFFHKRLRTYESLGNKQVESGVDEETEEEQEEEEEHIYDPEANDNDEPLDEGDVDDAQRNENGNNTDNTGEPESNPIDEKGDRGEVEQNGSDTIAKPEQPLQYDSTMCSICLTEYTPGDKELVNGSNCHHIFHCDCCLQWLKQHDHCPYCRKEMLSAEEFRKVAVETLGDDRVEALSIGHRNAGGGSS